nr:hypothetical protein [uncultured Flavobacterium sp.]
MKASITNLKNNQSVSIHLSNEIITHLKTRTIVVKEKLGKIFIRQSGIDDNKTYAISKTSNSFTYTAENSNDLIGKYNGECQGDFIVLYRA